MKNIKTFFNFSSIIDRIVVLGETSPILSYAIQVLFVLFCMSISAGMLIGVCFLAIHFFN
jgi:arginine exporter protein ArgO